MIQVLPQDQPLGARLAQNILPAVGEGFGQGMSNYTQNVQTPYLQQLANFQANQKAMESVLPKLEGEIEKLFPGDSPYKNAALATLRTNAALGMKPELSGLINQSLMSNLIPSLFSGGNQAAGQPGVQAEGQPGQGQPMQQGPLAPGVDMSQGQPMMQAGAVPQAQGQPVADQQVQPQGQSTGGPVGVGGAPSVSPQGMPINKQALAATAMYSPEVAQRALKGATIGTEAEQMFQELEQRQTDLNKRRVDQVFENNPTIANEVAGSPAAETYARRLAKGVNPENPNQVRELERRVKEFNRRNNEIAKLSNDLAFQTTGRITPAFQKVLKSNAEFFKREGMADEFEGKMKELGIDQLQRNEYLYPTSKEVNERINKVPTANILDSRMFSNKREPTIKSVEKVFRDADPRENFASIRNQLNQRGVPDEWVMSAYNNVEKDLDFSYQPVDVPGIMSQTRNEILRDESAIGQLLKTAARLIGGATKQ